MAIYTGGMRMQDEARAASKSIAAQQAKAQKAEAKRKGRAGIFGKLGGMALGTLAVGAMSLTGGLAAPLVMGAASSLGKKWADEASKKGIFKTPGQVSKITAGGKYGYGRQQAAEATKALKESRKTEFSAESMLGDIASSYLSAGVSGGLKGAGKTLFSGDKGSIAEALTGQKDWATQMKAGDIGGWQGAMSAIGLGQPEDVLSPLHDPSLSENVLDSPEYVGFPFEQDLGPELGPQLETETAFTIDPNTGEMIQSSAEGGQVMDQNTLLGLAILSQMQQQQDTAYSGTPLEEIQQSSIAEMFASQCKTLGGNNTQSLSQMLGR